MADDDEFDPWWRRGICAEIGPDLFFVGGGQPVTEAKKACSICPVRVQCLADSLTTDVEYGVFGGFARPMRRILAIQVGRGRDPIEVARAAIREENTKRRRVDWR